MHKYHLTISKIACLVFVSMLAWGCNSETETPQKTQVVSKKISAAKTQKATPVKKVAAAPKPATKAPVKKTPPVTVTAKPAATPVAAKPAMPEDKTVAATAGEDKAVTPVTTTSYLLTGIYDPSGKIDPFLPLYKEKPVTKEDEKKKKKKKRRLPLTPLEKVDISQLKLVGIIRAPSGNKALVQEATGKGYIVKKGTYIGIHAGRVIDILKDRLIVEEEIETALGTYELQKREMKIQKPPGEL